jgi:hypothetical protein
MQRQGLMHRSKRRLLFDNFVGTRERPAAFHPVPRLDDPLSSLPVASIRKTDFFRLSQLI